MSSSGGEEQRRRRGGQHELAEVDDTLADIPALFSVTPPNVSGADSPSSLMMSPRTSQRNGSAAAVGNLEEDDGYKSSGEQTPDNSQTGRRSRESCSDGDSSTKEGDVTTTNITTMATAMASNTTVGGGKNSKRNSRGMSASVDSKRRTSGNTAAANPLNEASDDDEEDIRTELVENGNIEGTAREDDGMTANCCTPPYPRGSFFTTCSGREMSSSREMVSCAHCADHHPLPKDDCDLLHELTEQQRQQQQQQQLTVRRKSRKLSGSSLEEECLYCASLRRRRMMAMRKRPTVASGLLRASGSGATTVWNNNNNNDNNNSNNNNNNNNNSVIKPAGRMVTSIGGHHLTILRDGMFMKESCSQREERFYEMLKPLQDYVWRHPELMDTLYSSLSSSSFSSSSDDNNNNNSDALEEKVSIRNSSYATMQRNWAQRRRLPKKNIRSVPCSIPSSNGSSISSADTAEDDSQRERRTAMAVCEGRHWDVLIPLIPFVPRFIGIRRVYVAKDGNVCKDGEWVSPVPKPQDGTLMGRSSALLASSGGGADRKEEADKKKIKDEDKNRGREEESKEMGEGEEVRQMIVMEDVCKGFVHPCILDIKMGSRQYGMNPSEAKLRSKEHKAALSTSMQYGVRLAGMKRWCPDTQQYETQSKIAGRHMSLDELREMVSRFTQSSKPLRHNFRKQVRHLRCTFMKQHVFRFFTSSLLFIYDADRPLMSSRVVMVDFAFTYEREELQRGGDPEAVYERDVGYIKALDTMLSILA